MTQFLAVGYIALCRNVCVDGVKSSVANASAGGGENMGNMGNMGLHATMWVHRRGVNPIDMPRGGQGQ